MKKPASNKAHRLVTIFTILAVFQLIVNNSIFIHTHYLANGQIVTHSHPFSKQTNGKDQNQKHHHSNSAFAALDNLAKVATFKTDVVNLNGFYFQQYYLRTYQQLHDEVSKTQIEGRAPPVLS